jgi:hypothetical protein
MKRNSSVTAFGFCVGASFAVATEASATTVVIDHDFDDAAVTGWMSQGNPRTFSAHNITENASVLPSEVVPAQTDTHRGIVSTTSFDPNAESGGFTMTFVVTSHGPPAPGANGFFIGAVADNSGFFRNSDNFGPTFFGTSVPNRTGSASGFGLVFGDNNGGAGADFILGDSDAQGDVEISSFQDGFSAIIAASPTGWFYNITGLNNAAGTPTTFAGHGTWAAAGTDFATLSGSDSRWFVTGSNQGATTGTPTHMVEYDRISVATVPEPASARLVLCNLGASALRRRRA